VYATGPVIHQATHHAWILVLLLIPGWTGGFIQIISAVRNGVRDRISSLPIAMTCGMLIHDLTYAANYDRYFGDLHHLLWRLSWIGMIPSVLIEFVLISQWWRWNAGKLAGPLSRPLFGVVAGAGLVCGFAFFWSLQSVMGDPLDLFGFVAVQACAVVFLVPWILSRGSTRGQSRAFAWATALGPASLGQVFVPYLSPAFRTWQCYLFIAATTVLGFSYALLYERYRKRERSAARFDSLAAAASA
jgi:hypothetical protein